MIINAVVFIDDNDQGTYVHMDGDKSGESITEAITNQGIEYVLTAIEENQYRGFQVIDPHATDLEHTSDVEYSIPGFGIGEARNHRGPITRGVALNSPEIEYIWVIDTTTGEVTQTKER